MTARVWAWLLSLSVLWGGSFFFAKVALGELAPLSVVFGRVALAAIALNLVLLLTAGSLFQRKVPWRSFFAMGLLNNLVPFALIFWGQTQIASGLASILNATTPLFTLVVAHFLTQDERIDAIKLGALVIGIGGVAVLMGPDALAGRHGVLGQLACLGAALSYAFAGVYGRRFKAMGVAPLDAAAGQVTASTMLILPIMLIVDQPWTLPAFPSATVWASLAGLALLSTALAYVLYFRILAAAGATNLLLVTFLIPVTAILLGVAVLGEHLLPRHFAGMALIGLSLAAIDGRLLNFLHTAK
jgi:drug/metabolite transporter (DMT)-like permease